MAIELNPNTLVEGADSVKLDPLSTAEQLSAAAGMAADGLAQVASGEQLLASSSSDSYGRLFGRDSLITSMQFLSAVRLDHSLAPLLLPPVQGSLRALAALQGIMEDPWTEEEPGKIPHEFNPGASGDFPGAYYASMDSTPLFLMALHEYAALRRGDGETRRWGDKRALATLPHLPIPPSDPMEDDLLEELRGARDRALSWIVERADLDGDGLVEFLQRNPKQKSLINQNWKDSRDSLLAADGSMPPYPVAYAELQAYCYRAVMGEAILRQEEEPSGAEELSRWAGRLAERFERQFWLPKADHYAQALDARKRPLKDISSNDFHWLWLGPVRPRRFRRAARRLLKPDMMTPFGLRTLSSSSPNYTPLRYHRGAIWPWDNWVAASALRRLGLAREAAAIDAAVVRALLLLGSPAELYVYQDGQGTPSPSFLDIWGRPAHACRVQAWTVGYLVEMLARRGAGEALLARWRPEEYNVPTIQSTDMKEQSRWSIGSTGS